LVKKKFTPLDVECGRRRKGRVGVRAKTLGQQQKGGVGGHGNKSLGLAELTFLKNCTGGAMGSGKKVEEQSKRDDRRL